MNFSYSPLASSDSPQEDICHAQCTHNKLESRAWKYIVYSSMLAALCFTLRSITSLTWGASSQLVLLRPDPYIGLGIATIGIESPPLKPVINLPIAVAQVNQAEQKQIYHEFLKRLTPYGMVYPLDKNITVTKVMSTVMQFRTIDYGMETCQLIADMPSFQDLLKHKKHKLYQLPSGADTLVDIWTLDATEELDVTKLSFATKPRRIARVGQWNVTLGYETLLSPKIPCPSRSILAFELACATEKCDIIMRQDEYPPFMAVYIKQTQE
ncbi:hypothetical protein GYMLUDRAFT_49750 [Collybiopsis luxurians FD-317 M1]|uniref:Ubiquitin 3 binding protein But2 C-terminal domain-containing protein n=1 Tax=Collybiopsis luxurians FD-317 M1 TaxID=944289 RepID=A0A0D0BDX0_9AGAR|nr:hypothetical protein GYMLUDRAFT_49750 [Collybiopsis luxurians FD-317 M1]